MRICSYDMNMYNGVCSQTSKEVVVERWRVQLLWHPQKHLSMITSRIRLGLLPVGYRSPEKVSEVRYMLQGSWFLMLWYLHRERGLFPDHHFRILSVTDHVVRMCAAGFSVAVDVTWLGVCTGRGDFVQRRNLVTGFPHQVRVCSAGRQALL